MFRNIKLFKMFGVDVFLNTTWFLIFVIFINWRNITPSSLLFDCLNIFLLFGIVLLHEFGHILAARKYGLGTDKVVLHMLGGAAIMDESEVDKLTHKQHMWVYFAGPLVNIVLIILSLIINIIYNLMVDVTEVDNFTKILTLMIGVNSVLFIFNIMPIFPMDGGGILRNFLQHLKIGNAILVSSIISVIFCILLLLLFTIYVFSITGIIIMSLFLIYGLYEIYKEIYK